MLVCTNCGDSVPVLYTKLPNGLIKMTICSKCGEVADKYVEYDLVIVMIDVFLLRAEAYRHILFNADSKIARSVFLLLVAEAYCKWVLDEHHTASRFSSSSGDKKFPFGSKSPLYFQAPGEWRFYYWFLISSLEAISCLLVAFLLLYYFTEKINFGKNFRAHFEAFVLGNIIKLLNLCILVWLPTQQSESYHFIVSMLAASSLFMAYQVVYQKVRMIFVFIAVAATFAFPFAIVPMADNILRPILFGGE